MLQSQFNERNERSFLDNHAAELQTGGLPPASRMCYESLLYSGAESTTFDLPDLHAKEGAKFAKLANQIAPAALIAKYVQENATLYPVIVAIGPLAMEKAAIGIIGKTDSTAGHVPQSWMGYHYPRALSEHFFRYSSEDPTLWLACFYLSSALQAFCAELAHRIQDTDSATLVEHFGKQFDNLNLVSVLPLALLNSLETIRGERTETRQINRHVILNALTTVHDTGQFAIKLKNPVEGGENAFVALQCPMESYIFTLLGEHEVLESVIAATHRANEAVEKSTSNDSDSLTVHRTNMEAVRMCARQSLLDMARFEKLKASH